MDLEAKHTNSSHPFGEALPSSSKSKTDHEVIPTTFRCRQSDVLEPARWDVRAWCESFPLRGAAAASVASDA